MKKDRQLQIGEISALLARHIRMPERTVYELAADFRISLEHAETLIAEYNAAPKLPTLDENGTVNRRAPA